jgi:hypothetical protein
VPGRVGEQQPVEAVVGFCGELQQPLARAPAAHDGVVHIQEVAWQSTSEQSADLVGNSVIRVQDRAGGKLNGIMGAPVDSQLDLLPSGPARASRVNVSALMITDTLQPAPSMRRRPVEDLDVEREYGASGAEQSVDDVVDGGGDDVWETAARTCRGVLGGVARVVRA